MYIYYSMTCSKQLESCNKLLDMIYNEVLHLLKYTQMQEERILVIRTDL
jgi:hypothetical protein